MKNLNVFLVLQTPISQHNILTPVNGDGDRRELQREQDTLNCRHPFFKMIIEQIKAFTPNGGGNY